ncbi:creatininase family protein [Nocardia sp. NBC_01329]|uniref:creatininase family protein n=1 Tax=Nocardia sp. NBC_01329 TaxID=2903594 RepID=UPI002E0F3E31|nr:creatininase family protein [Nocardia sp. NBC_01329]
MDIFGESMAEMTWYEVAAAAAAGAVLLWPIGVIEQHGPHLPTGTDVYIPTDRARRVKAALAERGVDALVVPPYYWGVNVVSGSFPASYSIRPSLMREVLADLFVGMSNDGFGHIFCFSGHGDALHNRTLYEGIRAGSQRASADISFVVDAALAQRLELRVDDPLLTVHGDLAPELPATAPRVRTTPEGHPFVDVHAGRWETSMMMSSYPELVREDARRDLRPTDHGPEELAVWRRGYDDARRITPHGYFGDPAGATADEGVRTRAASAGAAADAICRRLDAQLT